MNLKILQLSKSNNIIKKIKECIKCHKFNKNKVKNLLKNLKINYKNILSFKIKSRYNVNMNKISENLKNKYILEICKYLKIFKNFKKFFIKC
ncbi:hypothetical protein ASU29_037 [Candidatus Nasuia deltocephalinicola]|uniref:Uncharacterized protein n=1 Tax=Candidatus Nasuia deltocephalincola TaxID=1160784 RepID=A0A0S2UPF7_9PROT|nr:hypothetical protein ASU29_037 [Candidatus Nasuia deltocephalinicola]